MDAIISIMGLGRIIGGFLTFLMVPVIVWNLLICFLGYKLFRIQLAVMGFFFGSSIGLLVGAALLNSAIAKVLALILGALGAWLAYKIYLAGVFIAVFLSSTSLLTLLFSFMTHSFSSAIVVISILLAIALGVVCVIFHQSIVIIYTAVAGGLSAGMALALALFSPSLGIVLGIILSVLGVFVQSKLENSGVFGQTSDTGKSSADYRSLVSGMTDAFVKSTKDIASSINSKKKQKENRNPNQTVLVSAKGSYWTRTMPMLVTEIQIAEQGGGENEAVFLNLAVQNLTEQPILGFYFDAACYDLSGNQLEGVANAVFQDLNLPKGETWFSSKSIPLPDPAARSCVVTIQSVILGEGQAWKNESNAALSQLPPQAILNLPPELAGEFYAQIEEHLKVRNAKGLYLFSPEQENEYWRCSCGQHNIADTCASCELERDFLFSIFDDSKLQQQAEHRAAEKLRLEAERKKRMEEQAEAVRQKSSEAMESIKSDANSAAQKVKTSILPLINKAKAHKKSTILAGGGACVLIIVLIVGLSIYNSDYNRFFRAFQKEDYTDAREIYQSAEGNELEKIQNEILDKAKSIETQFKNRDITFKEANSSLNHLLQSTPGFMGLFGSDGTSSKLSEIQYDMGRLNDSRKAFEEGKKKLAEKDYSDAIACFSSVIEEDENYKAAQSDMERAAKNQTFLAMKTKLTDMVDRCGPLQSQNPRTPQITEGKNDMINASLVETDTKGDYGLLVTVYDSRYFTPAPTTTFYIGRNGGLAASWSDAFSGWYPQESMASAYDSAGNFVLMNQVKGSDTDFLKQRNEYVRFQPNGRDDTVTFEHLEDSTGAIYRVDGTTVGKEDWDAQQKAYTDLKWTPIVSTDESDSNKFAVHVDSKKSVEDTLAKLDDLMK